MSTNIYEVEEVTLIDGTKITLRPLKISLLRSFIKKFEAVSEVATDNEKSIDALLECVKIAMQQYSPELSDKDLEELLDLPTVYKIVEVASGIKLSDVSNILS